MWREDQGAGKASRRREWGRSYRQGDGNRGVERRACAKLLREEEERGI